MGTAVFSILRLADLPLQYYLLRYSSFLPDLIRRIGGTAIPLSSPLAATGIAGLSPYQTLILGLAAGSSAKQVYWKLMINDTNMPSGFSTAICAYNTLLNTLNTGLAFWAVTSQVPADQGSFLSTLTSAPVAVPVGIGLYTVGIFVEWYSEIQRKRFKSHPENKDKPYSDGLFGLARSINYGGYTLWRVGYSLICGGWTWGALVAVWLAGDFCARAIPSMDAYCEKRVRFPSCENDHTEFIKTFMLILDFAVWKAVGGGQEESSLRASTMDLLRSYFVVWTYPDDI